MFCRNSADPACSAGWAILPLLYCELTLSYGDETFELARIRDTHADFDCGTLTEVADAANPPHVWRKYLVAMAWVTDGRAAINMAHASGATALNVLASPLLAANRHITMEHAADHPVTTYNHAAPPEAQLCIYPNDPTIALKASQTVFPLDRNFCLILTNLDYARDP
jgi:hypothetical protein